MQDLLAKIIEMDEQARKIEQKAKAEKLQSEQEVEAMREQIYNEYIKRAKERIEKNTAVDQALAEERISHYAEQTEEKKQAMRELYDKNKNDWIDAIVSRALS